MKQPVVAIARCDSYEEGEVRVSLSKALAQIGGIGRFVKPDDKVLLKVNLLSPTAPERAITTHPAIVKAMISQIQSVGGLPIIADSPGGPFNKIYLDKVYDATGMRDVIAQTGARLNYNFSTMQVSNPDGKLLKRLDLIGVLADVDVVITMPKLKTHMLTQLTGATKILFGVVPGLTKPAYHLKFQDADMFSDMLLDILGYVKPSLSVMDAVIGIEGDGPGTHGTLKKVGALLASEDSVALDIVAANLVGMRSAEVTTLRRACERGMTSGLLEDIEVKGDPLEPIRVVFKKPGRHKGTIEKLMMSRGVRAIFLNLLAPYPTSNSKCISCGVCAQNCPVKAISISCRARMDLGKCIRCYCCHELCPHQAIDLKRNILARLL